MRIALSLVCVLFLSASAAPSLAADDRRALVIGNADYPGADAPLVESVNDARNFACELGRDGFVVTLKENLGRDDMRRAFDEFYASIKQGSVALIFFSGYGLQSRRESYLIPVDAQIWTEADIRKDGVGLEPILSSIQSRGASVEVAVIDASRRNPFERRFRGAAAGLAPVTVSRNTLVVYSTAPNELVEEKNQGLFVSELLKEIQVPGVTAGEALYRTQVGVNNATRGHQVPWISSTLVGAFSFLPGSGGGLPLPTPNAQTSLQPPPEAPAHAIPTPIRPARA